jgi:hypothetical protein
LATPNYGFEKRQKELAKKKKKEEKLKMKSELKSGLRAGDPIEGEPEDGVQDDTPPSTDQPDAPASPAGA